jgi:hypothetical protein
MLTKQTLKKLDCNNYQVCDIDGHYYLTDGRRSLKKFAYYNNLDYKQLLVDLATKHQVNVSIDRSITAI